MDRIGSGPCLMPAFGISSGETLCSAIRELVN